MRLVVISHAQAQEQAQARWRRLAETYPDSEVTLLVPRRWREAWFGPPHQWTAKPVQEQRFRVVPLPVLAAGDWNRYLLLWHGLALRRWRPDLLYVVQEEGARVLRQTLLYRRLWAPRAKLLFFSWNNIGVPLGTWRARRVWSRVRSRTDAAVAGTETVREVLGAAGYTKPILVQTELGVDERPFRPQPAARICQRRQLGLDGFVIGFAGRLVAEKGVLDLAEAVATLPPECQLLVVGDGPLRPVLHARLPAAPDGRPRLVCTGVRPLADMPDLLNAMDCLVLPSRTTPTWCEQFGLVLAQAMACAVPVVGARSGAIPEVIGDAGLLCPEGDPISLGAVLLTLCRDPRLTADLAERGRRRTLERYSAQALAAGFHAFARGLSSPPGPHQPLCADNH